MTADVIKPSRELVLHHQAAHARRCWLGDPTAMMCEHESTVILACGRCAEALFMIVEPGTQCSHAVEIRAGDRPTGTWTEVKV